MTEFWILLDNGQLQTLICFGLETSVSSTQVLKLLTAFKNQSRRHFLKWNKS